MDREPMTQEDQHLLEERLVGKALTGLCSNVSMPEGEIVGRAVRLGRAAAQMLLIEQKRLDMSQYAQPVPQGFPGYPGHMARGYSPTGGPVMGASGRQVLAPPNGNNNPVPLPTNGNGGPNG